MINRFMYSLLKHMKIHRNYIIIFPALFLSTVLQFNSETEASKAHLPQITTNVIIQKSKSKGKTYR